MVHVGDVDEAVVANVAYVAVVVGSAAVVDCGIGGFGGWFAHLVLVLLWLVKAVAVDVAVDVVVAVVAAVAVAVAIAVVAQHFNFWEMMMCFNYGGIHYGKMSRRTRRRKQGDKWCVLLATLILM